MKNVNFSKSRSFGIGLIVVLCAFFWLPNISASQPFGTSLGQFNTVISYSNGGSTCSPVNNSCSNSCNNCINGSYIGLKWQCVEYVRRYYYIMFNTNLAALHTGNANTWYANASAMRLTQYDGHNGTAPQVGDILCSNSGGEGHIAIIKSVSDNNVRTIQQNFSNEASDTDKVLSLSFSNGTYTIGNFDSLRPVIGWLRKIRQPGQSNVTWHPDGTLLQANDGTGTIWLIENGKKRGIPDDFTFAKYGFSWWRIIKASSQELSCFPPDTNLQSSYTKRLLRRSDGAIFLITDKGYKRVFASMDVFYGLGYSLDQVIQNADAEIAFYTDDPAEPAMYSPLPDGTLVQGVPNGAVYIISNGRKRRLDLTAAEFQNAGWGFDQVVLISQNTLDNIQELPPINSTTLGQCLGTITGSGGADLVPTFTTAASASTSPATLNQPLTITTTVTDTGGRANDVIVDTEIYNASNQRVFQSFSSSQFYEPNQTRTYTSSPWTPTTSEQYRVKIGVFNNSWTTNYHWNDNALTLSVGSSSPPPPANSQIDIWWPSDSAQVSGTQPFQAIVTGLSLSQYNLYWQVDSGQLNLIPDNFNNYPHKEVMVDLSGWTWRGTGPYLVNFIAKDVNGNIIAQRGVNIYVSH